MQIIENSQIKEKVYIEKLENGLTIMIIPKSGIQKKYAIWGTNYGSVDNKFIVPGETEITEVPKPFLNNARFSSVISISLKVILPIAPNLN